MWTCSSQRPTAGYPTEHELKPGAEEEIYRRIGDICVSMRASDHLQMPERVDNVVELTLSPHEEKLYKQMERDMLLPYADGDVLAINAATLAGKLLQLANGAVYDEFRNIRVVHDKKLDALEDLIEAANGKPVLVMYSYKHDLSRIQGRFGKWSPENECGVRELKTSQDMTDWNAGRILVAATQPASTAHGLNIQHGGSTIVWFGLNWSLELYEQANARLWRQGQKETVVIQSSGDEGYHGRTGDEGASWQGRRPERAAVGAEGENQGGDLICWSETLWLP